MTAGENPTIAGKYRLLDLIGRGGMGSVWRAEHLTLKSHVAIKLVDPQTITHPDALARFMREAQAAASLRSPHVVQILDHGVDGETPYIVMELLEGESLAARLGRERTLSPKATAEIITQVCRAVSRAHERGIVHRDLKPDNIFLVADDELEIAKVLDFGIAKHAAPGSHGMTQTGAVLGTPYYMSPEQAEGARDVDFRTDLWALSVIAYECLVGKRPFEEETLGALVLAICARPLPIPSEVATVPSGFNQWFARGIARDRLKRFDSARELAGTLRQVCGLDVATQSGSSRGSASESVADADSAVQAGTGPLGGTDVPVSVTSGGEDKPILPPMHVLGWHWKLLLVGLGLAGAAATYLFVRGTESTAVSVPATGLASAAAAVPSVESRPVANGEVQGKPPVSATPVVSVSPSAGSATPLISPTPLVSVSPSAGSATSLVSESPRVPAAKPAGAVGEAARLKSTSNLHPVPPSTAVAPGARAGTKAASARAAPKKIDLGI